MIEMTLPFLAMTPLALIACWLDITQRRLPNWLVLITFTAGMGLALIGPGTTDLLSRLEHVFIALVVGMGLYRVGLVGAGDAKFYAAVAAWFSLARALNLLLAVALCGFVFAASWIILRRLSPRDTSAAKTPDQKKLPFGVAIAGGALLALLLAY